MKASGGVVLLMPSWNMLLELILIATLLQAADGHTMQYCTESIRICVAAAGGMAEYEAVSSFMAELDSRSWVSSETRLLNRSTAPRLLLSHRLAGRGAEQRWRPNFAFADAPQP